MGYDPTEQPLAELRRRRLAVLWWVAAVVTGSVVLSWKIMPWSLLNVAIFFGVCIAIVGTAVQLLHLWDASRVIIPPIHGPFFEREVTVSGIVSAKSVDDLEDFGPGYVVETADGELVFFAHPLVADHDSDGQLLAETVTLRVTDLDYLLGMNLAGERVEVDAVESVSSYSLRQISDRLVGFALLSGQISATSVESC